MHYDERYFQPIHVYDTTTAGPVTVLLRKGKTPSGAEISRQLIKIAAQITKTAT